MIISAALIVRDEGANLAACLETVAPLVDEIVVVDTGSSDATPSVAERLAARLFHFEWADDFSAARNEALRHARGDYVLVIDADERIMDPFKGRDLLEQFVSCHDDDCAGTVEVNSVIGQGASQSESVVILPRFFRQGRFHYRGAIHEQLVPKSGGRLRAASTGLSYLHQGYAHPVSSPLHKSHRNKRMLYAELARHPHDEYCLYQLGKAHFCFGEFADAIRVFEESLLHLHFAADGTVTGDSGLTVSAEAVADLLTSLAYAYVNTGHPDKARTLLETSPAGSAVGGEFPDVPHALGYVRLVMGDVANAKRAYEAALRLGPRREQVRGTGSYSAHYHLGLLCEAENDIPAAIVHYKTALSIRPDYPPAHARLLFFGP